jgi:hypothetical protein
MGDMRSLWNVQSGIAICNDSELALPCLENIVRALLSQMQECYRNMRVSGAAGVLQVLANKG